MAATMVLGFIAPLQLNGVESGLMSGISSFLTQIFLFFPHLIAALLILLVGYLVMRAVTKAVQWGMNTANLEKHVRQTRIGQGIERSGLTITELTVGAVKWLLILIVVVYAISALNIPPLTASMLGILAWIPNLIGAAIIVFAGLLIGSWIGKWIEKVLPRYGISGARIIGLVIGLLIYFFTFDLAAIQLGVGRGIIFVLATVMTWGLAAALAIGFGGALFFALKEVLPTIFAGSTIIASTLKPGQTVRIEGIEGYGGPLVGMVASVGMFNTILEERGDGQQGRGFIILPNDLLIDKPIVVQRGEVPKPFELRVRDRLSDFNHKFESQMDSTGNQQQLQTIDRTLKTRQRVTREYFAISLVRWVISSPLRSLTIAVSAISLAFGLREAYSAFHQRNIIQHCINGAASSCQIPVNSIELQNMLSNARLLLDLSGALVLLAVCALAYSIMTLRKADSGERRIETVSFRGERL